jgi:undecaprenyl diphosphate synthase
MSDTNTLPKHLGIIIDGNRRWAQSQGVPNLEGHREGSEVFKEIALAAFERGIQYVSAYVFSTENWSRTEEEVGYLMKLVIKAMEKYLKTFHEKGIKILVLGRRTQIPGNVLEAIERTELKTKDNTEGTLALCFNYGGREEIADAFRNLAGQRVEPDKITEELVRGALYSPEIPDVDLIIRTSGERRLSGFMLYRSEYAELYFSNKFWPDFTVDNLDEALADYAGRQRRFGT